MLKEQELELLGMRATIANQKMEIAQSELMVAILEFGGLFGALNNEQKEALEEVKEKHQAVIDAGKKFDSFNDQLFRVVEEYEAALNRLTAVEREI